MPSKNTVKFYDTDTYYHVYNRGVEKRTIFIDDDDYIVFLHLLKRYLGDEPEYDSSGREYARLTDEVELIAFCLMPNHFHLLLYQYDTESITKLMRAVATSYTRYFNQKYQRVGSLYQGIYKASQIDNDQYLQHITRYIHRNPTDYMAWEWSSLQSYIDQPGYSWVHPEKVIDVSKPQAYIKFLQEYDESSEEILHSQLADH